MMSQDRQLQEAVLAQFLWEPSVIAAHIGVTASDGVVTLTGHVPNYLAKLAAEKAAARVRGVKAVAQEIEVVLPNEAEYSDAAIARAAIERIGWEVSIPTDAIKLEIEDGWIMLTGEVEWHFQKDAAESVIRGLRGVVGISNHITLKPHINVADISHDIGTALHRSWFDPSTIRVTADGSKVTLKGTVHTPGDKWTASSTAWGSRGITEVENDLVVVG
jgi:osmotically-inducible protein OsmY